MAEGEARKRVNENSVITITTENGANPKRAGSKAFDRFAKYENGMTVKQAKEAGVTATDIAYDFNHNHIALEAPAEEESTGEAASEGEAAPRKRKSRAAAAEAEAAAE